MSTLAKLSEDFPSSIDIFHCDDFTQFPAHFGDYMLHTDVVHGVSYILSSPRDSLEPRLGKLYNNEKNIRHVYKSTKKKDSMDENPDCDSLGRDWCPF